MPTIDLKIIHQNIIPNKIQHYLLKSAIADFNEAHKNWDLLKQELNINYINSTELSQLFDKLDIGSRRLLPMIYKNLEALNDPLLHSIKSYYRYTWTRNYYSYKKLQELLKLCADKNSNPVLLKGMAIAFHYADNPAIRVMDDVDALINPEKVDSILAELDKKYSALHPYQFSKKNGYTHAADYHFDAYTLDLHWNIFSEQSKWNIFAEKNCFENIKDGSNFLVLNPTYAFLHSIIHGVKPNAVSTIRWISDCYLIQKKNAIDWDIIITVAIKLNYIERIRIAAAILPEYNVPIPQKVIDQIDAIPKNNHQIKHMIAHKAFSNAAPYSKKRILNGLYVFYYENRLFREKNIMVDLFFFAIQRTMTLFYLRRALRYLSLP